MESKSGKTIVSGIEPVDELMGGLDRGELYLVHGEASGKSLFGIKFLIEGLKRGENGALVIRYSPEDAVQRFARLGYDCLEDVYSGRLVILEYSDDIIQKVGKLRELTPVLRELEWLLGETRPERLIFDPLTSVLAGVEGNLEAPAREFANWARSFGATVVLIAQDSNREIINSFQPLVGESFRFDVRESGERASRFLAFEKSTAIEDQAIEVDPSRGVFLLGRWYASQDEDLPQSAPQPPSTADLASIRDELRSTRELSQKEDVEPPSDADLAAKARQTDRSLPATESAISSDQSRGDVLQTRKLTPVEERAFQTPRERVISPTPDSISNLELEIQLDETPATSPPAAQGIEVPTNELSDLLDDLTGMTSPLELDLPELQPAYGEASTPSFDLSSIAAQGEKEPEVGSSEGQSFISPDTDETAVGDRDADSANVRSPGHGRASDRKIESAMAARAVDLLLSSPESGAESSPANSQKPHPVPDARQPEPLGETEVYTEDFNVLIIQDDPETNELVTKSLADYTVEVAHDGVSGLAKLLSFKPDLVVLDFDLPVIDGFKVLTLIRSALNVPIIIVTGSHVRAIDRVMASELGADYYLTKPFSAKELKHKARQLIARYRGISTWITNPRIDRRVVSSGRRAELAASPRESNALFIPYTEFETEVEKRVKAAMDNGAPFSVVGCRLPQMTANSGKLALRLLEIAGRFTRDTDVTSTNRSNDLVILLPDSDTAGAKSFAGRLLERIAEELNVEPKLWMRSFPELEESTEPAIPGRESDYAGAPNRRLGDMEAPLHSP